MRRWPSFSLSIVLCAAVAETACGDSFTAESDPENSGAGDAGQAGEPQGGAGGSSGRGGSSGTGTTGGRGGSAATGGSTATGGDSGDAGEPGTGGSGGGAMGGSSGASGASGTGGNGGASAGAGAGGRSGAGGGGASGAGGNGGASGVGGVGGVGGKGGTSGTSGTGGKGGTGGTGGSSGSGGSGGGPSCAMNCQLSGLTCCNGRCVNTNNDIKNCGECGEACGGNFPYCGDGTCSVPVCLGPDCGPAGACCNNECCGAGELCCKVPGGPDGPPRCTTPVDGTCPIGCPSCPCASPGTPVATPSGERPIAELRPGDLVYSVHDRAIVAVPIERANKNPVAGHYVLRIRLETGVTLEISAMHPTADGRTVALSTPGSELGGVKVVAVDEVPYEHPYTYDILPASDTGTYFAGGALVGSTLFASRALRE